MKRLIHSNPRAQSGDAGSIPAVASVNSTDSVENRVIQPNRLNTYDVYYFEDRPVQIVSTPKGSHPTVLYVRDIESGMCFLAKSYQVVYRPASR